MRINDEGKSMAHRTPLYDWHQAHGGHLVEFGGWELPVRFSSIVEEHQAVRNHAGLFDISHMGRLSFSGPGALDLIQKVYTNNAATMKEGQARYGLVCNQAGGIRDDVLVYRWPERWGMVVNASNREKIVGWLQQARAGHEVEVMDITRNTTMLAVQGPKALELCRGVVECDLDRIAYYHCAPGGYRGEYCACSRTGYTGEEGVEFTVRAELGPALCDELLARGVRPCGLGARDTLRLEAAMPLYGHELSEEIDPLQAGLGWAVKLDKGDFIGRQALLERQKDTSRPVRVGLEVEGRRAAREGAALLAGDKPVGKVTSGTITPTLGKAIAMAYVAPEHAAVGSVLTVDLGREQTTPARVVRLPFYKRAKS
jgi:aminomethyltransferase